MSFKDVSIVYVNGIQFWSYTKSDAISIMNKSSLIDKKGDL